MGFFSSIGDMFSAPVKAVGGLLGGGGGDSSSSSQVANTTNLENNITNIIDTTQLDKTLQGFSDGSLEIGKNLANTNRSIAETLRVLAENSNIDNKQQDAILKGGAVIVSGVLTYIAIKNNRGKNGK